MHAQPHTLQEIGRPSPHPGVDIRLGGFDVVMEVVSESLNMRNDFLASCVSQVSREQDCSC
jgi:hypothetical protein